MKSTSELSAQSSDFESARKRLLSLLFSERSSIALIAVYGIAVGVLSLAVPIAAQSVVNSVAFTHLLQPLLFLALAVLGILGVSAVLRLIQTALVELLQQRIFARVAMDLAFRLPRVQYPVFDSIRGTHVATRFLEVITIQKTLALMLLDALAIVLQGAIGLVLLAFYHPLLLAFDLLILTCIALGVILPAKKAVETAIKESKTKYDVAGWLVELARNPMVFKMSGATSIAMSQADTKTTEYIRARRKHFKNLIQQIGLTLVVQATVSSLLLGLGGFLVVRQQLTLGQLVAAEIVVTIVVAGFAKFGKYFESFYDLMASVDKLGNLFDLPLERDGGLNFEVGSGSSASVSIELHRLSFQFENRQYHALKDVSLSIPKGARIGIHGTNGSGKSTLFDLMLGFRHPSEGRIEINGIDLRELNLESFRRRVAVVRGIDVIDGTLFENIALGRSWVSVEDVHQALRRVYLLEDVLSLSQGLQTPLSGNTNPLSRGQSQRLMIARALAGKPSLLLLDEAIEGVDDETKSGVLDTLYDIQAPWTLVTASLDTEELARCTAVVRLESGQIYADQKERV